MIRLAALVIALAPLAAPAVERPVLYGQSEIAFTVTQMGARVTGVFRRFSARVNLDRFDPAASFAEVEVDIASLDTGDAESDTEAREPAWLDAVAFPKAIFSSRSIRPLGGGRYEARGTITIKGRARPVVATLTLQDRRDGTSVAAGEFVLRRTEFRIGGGEWNAEDLVADEVPVRFRITLGAVR